MNETRQRIIDYLLTNGPVEDESGRVTAMLKVAVGYTEGDAGFSQLISSMEKDGQLRREIRGKRTYRIDAASEADPGVALPAPSTAEEFDYDELAAALLTRTAQVLATSQGSAEPARWARRRIEQLEGRVDELQRELARAKAEATANAEERDELRGQLEAASHNLSLLTERRQTPRQGRAAQRLGTEEQALLFELRSHRRRTGRQTGQAG